jgi:hypothetical protein
MVVARNIDWRFEGQIFVAPVWCDWRLAVLILLVYSQLRWDFWRAFMFPFTLTPASCLLLAHRSIALFYSSILLNMSRAHSNLVNQRCHHRRVHRTEAQERIDSGRMMPMNATALYTSWPTKTTTILMHCPSSPAILMWRDLDWCS